MVGIFDCGGVLGKYEIRLKERKVVNMEALNTYKTEKTLAEQMNERLAEMKMTKAEAALKMNYSRAALSQYLKGGCEIAGGEKLGIQEANIPGVPGDSRRL